MKVFQYWVKKEHFTETTDGGAYELRCWGGSNESVDDAGHIAQSKLTNLIDKVTHDENLNDYEYGTEIRELLVEEVHSISGELVAAITRNRYGALVLNARNTFIADIDAQFPGCLTLFSSQKKIQAKQLLNIEEFAKTHPELGIRLYKTHSGFRLFITSEDISTVDPRAKEFLEQLKSDYLYRILCFKQECYRARLTPKPWRVGLNRPEQTLPDMNDEEWANYTEWLQNYEENSHGRGVCHLLNTWGTSSMSDNTRRIVELHDRYALCDNSIELA